MNFEFTQVETGRGKAPQFRLNGQNAVFYAPSAAATDSAIGESISALEHGVAATGSALAASVSDLSPEGFMKRARETVLAHVRGPFGASQSAIAMALDATEQRLTSMRTPQFGDAQIIAVRVEQRAYSRTLSLPALLDAVAADPSLGAAIVEGGQGMSGVSPDIFARLVRTVAITNTANMLRRQRDHRVAPTPNNPVAGQPDEKALQAEAELFVAAVEARHEMLQTAPDILRAAIEVVALLSDQTRDAAFTALTE